MDPWQKESLVLQVGDLIIWRDEAVEMEGQVISLPDGFHLDVTQGDSIPPKAVVQYSGITLMVDERMKWERVT